MTTVIIITSDVDYINILHIIFTCEYYKLSNECKGEIQELHDSALVLINQDEVQGVFSMVEMPLKCWTESI